MEVVNKTFLSMPTIEDIIIFVKEETLSKHVAEDSDIDNDLGCTGNDFSDLMEKYAEKFQVDMTNYRWYFHHDEEGSASLGGLFFKSPRELVKHIPVTPKILLEYAKKQKWDLDYPQHHIPTRRYDILINQIFVTILFLAFLWTFLRNC